MKLKLSMRFGLLVGGLSVVFVIVAFLSFYSMDYLLNQYDYLGEHVQAKERAALTAAMELQYAIHEYKNYLLRDKQKYREAWFEHVNNIKRALSEYEKEASDETDRKFLQEAKIRLAEYEKSMPRLDEAKKSIADIKGLDRAVKGVDRPLMAAFIKMKDDAEKDYEILMGVLDHKANRVKTIIFVITIVGVLIAIGYAFMIVKKILASVKEIKTGIERVASGDLTWRAKKLSKDEFGEMTEDFNKMVEKLSHMASRINDSAMLISSNTEQTSASTAQIYSGIEDQASQIEQVAAASTEIAQSISGVAENANSASEAARASLEEAKKGKEVISLTVSTFNQIMEKIENLSSTIEVLQESSKNIGEITQVINDIAEQTNLLALNAAIEAARAGEKGKGFAVVADEVRKLAERTADATNRISKMIANIQKDVEISTEQMRQGSEKIKEGVELSDSIKEAIERIIRSSTDCYERVESIATSIEEQSAATEQITSNLENISSISMSSRDAVEQINVAMEELRRLSYELKDLVQWFNFKEASLPDKIVTNTSSQKTNRNSPDVPVGRSSAEPSYFHEPVVSGNGEKNT